MNEHSRHSDDSGFTLVEVLVTVLILGLLAAVVFPVVIPQINKADPTVAANDLANYRTGIELFKLDVRPQNPGDLEDLVNAITTADADIDGSTYTSGKTGNWDGPYVDRTMASTSIATSEDANTTGFDGTIEQDLCQYNSDNNTADCDGGSLTGTADFTAIEITGLTKTDFDELDSEIDGTNSTSSGKLRYFNFGGSTTSTFFLATPIK